MRYFLLFVFLAGGCFLFQSGCSNSNSASGPTTIYQNNSPAYGSLWNRATGSAGFSQRDGMASVVFNNQMWSLGGYDTTQEGDAWSSSDGVSWSQQGAAGATFTARAFASAVTFNNKIWVMAGLGGSGGLADTWSSSDGAHWTQSASGASTFTSRFGQASLVFNNKIWVIGGYGASGVLNDVWSSSDGVSWASVTTAPFAGREFMGAAVYNNAMWVVAGENADTYALYNDVWNSTDGSTWTRVAAHTGFAPRGGPGLVVYNNALWLIAGTHIGSSLILYNDVWTSTDGIAWTQVVDQASFPGRDSFGLLALNNRLYLFGGDGSTTGLFNDVWNTP